MHGYRDSLCSGQHLCMGTEAACVEMCSGQHLYMGTETACVEMCSGQHLCMGTEAACVVDNIYAWAQRQLV